MAKKMDSKANPWAVCTASVGRGNKAKYESCVQQVKKSTNYKKPKGK